MAEWLGRQMAGWPGWLLFIAIIVLTVLWFFYFVSFEGGADIPWQRRRNLKQREKELHHAKK